MAWNPQTTINGANWYGNTPIATQRQISSIYGSISSINNTISSSSGINQTQLISTLSSYVTYNSLSSILSSFANNSSIITSTLADASRWSVYPAIHNIDASNWNIENVNVAFINAVNSITENTGALTCVSEYVNSYSQVGNTIINSGQQYIYGMSNVPLNPSLYVGGGLTVDGGIFHGISMSCLPLSGVNTTRLSILPDGVIAMTAPTNISQTSLTNSVNAIGEFSILTAGAGSIYAGAIINIGAGIYTNLDTPSVRIINSIHPGQSELRVDSIQPSQNSEGYANNYSINGSNATMSNITASHQVEPGYLSLYDKYFSNVYPYPINGDNTYGIIAGGLNNGLIYSKDGTNLTSLGIWDTGVAPSFINAYTTGTNTFWITASLDGGSSSNILYSTDGVNFSLGDLPTFAQPRNTAKGTVNGVANSYLLSLSEQCAYSPNGINWTVGGFTNLLDFTVDFAWNPTDNFWICVGNTEEPKRTLKTSPDGLVWTDVIETFGGTGTCIIYAESKFMAGGYSESGYGIVYSTDNGTTWLGDGSTTGFFCYKIAFDDVSKYVAVGQPYTKYSTDGIVWTDTAEQFLTDVTWNFNLNKWYAIYSESYTKEAIYSSSDGITWEQVGDFQFSQSGRTIASGYIGNPLPSPISNLGISTITNSMTFCNAGVGLNIYISTPYIQDSLILNLASFIFDETNYIDIFNEKIVNNYSPSTSYFFSSITSASFVDIIPTYPVNVFGSTIYNTIYSTINFSTISSIGSTLQNYTITNPTRLFTDTSGNISILSPIPSALSTILSTNITNQTDFITTCYDFTINNMNKATNGDGNLNFNASRLNFGVSTFGLNQTILGHDYPIQFYNDTQFNCNVAMSNLTVETLNATNVNATNIFANDIIASNSVTSLINMYCVSIIGENAIMTNNIEGTNILGIDIVGSNTIRSLGDIYAVSSIATDIYASNDITALTINATNIFAPTLTIGSILCDTIYASNTGTFNQIYTNSLSNSGTIETDIIDFNTGNGTTLNTTTIINTNTITSLSSVVNNLYASNTVVGNIIRGNQVFGSLVSADDIFASNGITSLGDIYGVSSIANNIYASNTVVGNIIRGNQVFGSLVSAGDIFASNGITTTGDIYGVSSIANNIYASNNLYSKFINTIGFSNTSTTSTKFLSFATGNGIQLNTVNIDNQFGITTSNLNATSTITQGLYVSESAYISTLLTENTINNFSTITSNLYATNNIYGANHIYSSNATISGAVTANGLTAQNIDGLTLDVQTAEIQYNIGVSTINYLTPALVLTYSGLCSWSSITTTIPVGSETYIPIQITPALSNILSSGLPPEYSNATLCGDFSFSGSFGNPSETAYNVDFCLGSPYSGTNYSADYSFNSILSPTKPTFNGGWAGRQFSELQHTELSTLRLYIKNIIGNTLSLDGGGVRVLLNIYPLGI